ncbi:hypothetical protein KP509_28G024700 [Ceratopteris richardii]|uniref:Uncharacterized protein n=1 Tax=Ceratopteris richardii TaxID=49495 RepID=A0A8T2RAF9_CERRI|nr:hypothetical protein KP509_28G024700 [Ceratopteris richardii]
MHGIWNMMYSFLHGAMYVLHPIWREKCLEKLEEVNDVLMDVIENHKNGDFEEQGILCDELDTYKSMLGTYALPLARDKKRMQYIIKWWETFGAYMPNLQRLAPRIPSKETCTSPCKKNWSTFYLIHTRMRIFYVLLFPMMM